MLNEKDIINDKNAIAKYICEEMDKYRDEQMNEDLLEIYTHLFYLNDEEQVNKMYDEIKSKSWILQSLEKRQDFIFDNKKIEPKILIFITSLADGRIGAAIMYLYYLQWYCSVQRLPKMTFEIFSLEVFPDGFCSEKNLHTIWENTKVKTFKGISNLIDYTKCAQSFIK